jgi:copper chaperone CopZ
MRALAFPTSVALLVAGAIPLHAGEPSPAPAPKPEVKVEFVYLEYTGVDAPEAEAVAKATSAVEGVRSFKWTTEASEAKVVREAGKAADASLAKAATTAGAATAGVVPLAATTFTFEKKLHCGGCVSAVKRALRGIKGVKESTVPEEMTTVVAVYDTRVVKPADIEAVLATIGKPAKAPSS